MSTLNELQQTIAGKLYPHSAVDRACTTLLGRVVTDSRHVRAGDVFWGLEGRNHNGSDFAWEALSRGASGVIVDQPIDLPAGCWAIQVPDTLGALWQWAGAVRRQFTGHLIAVTGSVGKTTTRQMIHTVLRSRLKGTASPRNFNNHVGLPLSMLDIKPEHDYAVLELGASQPGEIGALASLCLPRIGVITRVADAHLGGFGSREGVAKAKAELLDVLPPDGRAILGDDLWLRSAARDCHTPITWIGTSAQCDLVAHNLCMARGRFAFRVGATDFSVPIVGKHHVTGALAAIAVGRILGFDWDDIASALAGFEPLPQRCEVLEVRGATIINDTYNASPTAMLAALELLREFDSAGRRIVIVGDMGELGNEAGTLHWELGNQVVNVANADLLIACGQFAGHVVAAARAAGMNASRTIHCKQVDEVLPRLGQAVVPGDTILVKGSRMMAMERVVEALASFPRRRSA
jgi:UDP-N-acetylmuramoyl-tripeptide--D-alanyl-D-alanine ligase